MPDMDFSIVAESPAPEYERMRAEGPIIWSESLKGWVVSSYDDVKKVISDSACFAAEGTPIGEAFSLDAMLVIDTPLHHKIRAVWSKPASLSAVDTMTADLELIADAVLRPAAARLKSGEEVDLVRVFEDFTSDGITFLLDISRSRRGDFQRWNRIISDAAVLALDAADPRYAAREQAKAEVYAFLGEEIEKRRAMFAGGKQPTDLISLMLAAEGQDGITNAIALGNILILFLGALDTTVRWLGNIVMTLHRHPDVLEEVRSNRLLLPKAIEEVMRLETVVQIITRIVRNDNISLRGQKLAVNDFIYGLPGAANRDPAVFERPDEFDIHRKPKLQLGFGFGMHQCLGMNIARKEAAVFIHRLLDLMPEFSVLRCRYGSSWALWGPHSLIVRAS